LLLEFGVEHEAIREMAGTGLVVDLKGKGPAKGSPRCIAFRADMDALSMIEENPHLIY
jgi:hippurate hydrolase